MQRHTNDQSMFASGTMLGKSVEVSTRFIHVAIHTPR
jgi:hypothetical protein